MNEPKVLTQVSLHITLLKATRESSGTDHEGLGRDMVTMIPLKPESLNPRP